MNSRTALYLLPLLVVSAPALAQEPPPPPAEPAPAPVAAEPAPAPAPVVAPAPAPEPVVLVPVAPVAPPADVPPPPPPEKVTVSKNGFFQPSATLQVWGVLEHLGTPRTDANKWQSTVRVRRAEIKAKGEIVPKTIGYSVMFDPARLLEFKSAPVNVNDPMGAQIGSTASGISQPAGAINGPQTALSGSNTSILQDVELTYMNDYADVSIGQFKIPVSYEGYNSASKLLFPERALVSRRFGDRRDLGLKVTKKFEYFSYYVGLFNGEGQNNLDTNDQKDLAGRLEVYPVKGLTVALAGYTSIGDRDLVGTKDRYEADIKFEHSGFLLQAEGIRGWDMTGSAASHTRVFGQGFYVVAGYTLFDKLQPVVRIGSLDPAVHKDERGSTTTDPLDETNTYEFGLNYYIKQHDAKMQLAASFFDPEQKSQKTTFDLILAGQVAF